MNKIFVKNTKTSFCGNFLDFLRLLEPLEPCFKIVLHLFSYFMTL